MKARIIDPHATVYSKPDLNSALITQLLTGNEVEVGSVINKGDRKWVSVQLQNGQRGYLPGETKIFSIKQVVLLQDEVSVYSAPFEISSVKSRLKKNSKFIITEVVNQDGKNWAKIRDAAGMEGYIDGKTRIKNLTVISKAAAKKTMLYGFLLCFAGAAITVVSYSFATSGGTYIVSWGAIILGGIQFLRGLFQYLRAPA
jgi:hypothetical protein